MALLYVIKVPILIIGMYITYQTRHVTLPSLKDTKQVYVVVHTVAILGLVALPIVTTARVGVQIKYSVGSLLIFIITTTTLTLLFLPKVRIM